MSESLGNSFVLRTSTSATNSNHQEKSSKKFDKASVRKLCSFYTSTSWILSNVKMLQAVQNDRFSKSQA